MSGATAAEECEQRAVVSLLDPTATVAERFGGKGSRLAAMRQAGFSVPDAFLVDVEAFAPLFVEPDVRDALSALSAEAAPDFDARSQALIEAISAAEIPISLGAQMASCLAQLEALAVRSSAVREDGPQRAGAGQYESILAVTTAKALDSACKAVTASQFSPHALRYWGPATAPPHNEMALILQRMLAPSASGVIFTVDPVSGRDDVLVLEACFGLGTSVVRGGGASERATIRRNTAEVESRSLRGGRESEHFDSVAATVIKRLQPAGESHPVLSPLEVTALVETACAVEDLFGVPVDVEWSIEDGRLQLLQARPVTAAGGRR
jgi:pyruvate,water dikinase